MNIYPLGTILNVENTIPTFVSPEGRRFNNPRKMRRLGWAQSAGGLTGYTWQGPGLETPVGNMLPEASVFSWTCGRGEEAGP